MTGSGIVAWLAGEVFDLSLGVALGRVMRRRAEAARDILQEELARAKINVADAVDKDEAAAMVFEYTEAARQGAARRNLRMLAQIMAGELTTPPVYADEFLRWTRLLADLTREEIIVLARYWAVVQNPPESTENAPLWKTVESILVSEGVFINGADFTGTLQSLTRTGLIIQTGTYGGIGYRPTPKLEALMNLIDIEQVLAEPQR